MTDIAETDRALYIRIKVLHPYWSDEVVKKEIEKLRSEEFAEELKALFANVLKFQNERQVKDEKR